jgi:hypothetical protein
MTLVRRAIGDHVCAVVSGRAKRNELLLPLLQGWLTSGRKCLVA